MTFDTMPARRLLPEARFDSHAISSFARTHQISRAVAAAILSNATSLAAGTIAVAKMRGQS
ncbi:MAG: hypothetical protein JWQ65_3108 [Devosia sp.]|nr:hypothetical protein [Devosia sp.]